MSEKLEFRVSSALKNIVGKDLITNDYVAIFELVKNSFDARASRVSITFKDNSIIIADNGKGMSYEDIKNKWLFLAYSAKKDGTEDYVKEEDFRDKIQERRYYAGAKGIGRFSSDRLGQELVLTTKTDKSNSCEQIYIDWTMFEEDQEKEFVEISVDHNNISFSEMLFPNKSTHGTILEINKLNDEWPSQKLKQLRQSLEKLINPFSETNSFSIEIICERELEEDRIRSEDSRINGVLKNTILDALNQKTTQINVTISSTDIVTEIKDRGVNIYKIKEANYEPLLMGTSIHLLFLNRSARHTFTYRMGIQPNNYGSIFLYKNGFRIYPYGESNDDDSWRIDSRKQQGYNRFLGSRDLIGKVEINTNHHEEFKETSSRDGGLVLTRGAKLLHEAFDKAHRRLERYVVGVLWGEGFLKRDFFLDENIGREYRDELKKDKDLDDISNVKSNLGSRLDFIQIIKSLAKDKDIEILEYNEELTKLIADELDTVKIDILKDVEEIAIRTGNESLKDEIEKIATALKEEIAKREEALLKTKVAELKLKEEIARREEAQLKAEKAEKERQLAEENRKKEELAKKEAELKQKEAEQKSREENIKRKEAELKQKEAEEKAREENLKRQEAEEKKETAEKQLEKETKQGIFQRSIIGKEKEQILGLQHQINHSSSRIKNNINRLLKYLINSKVDQQILKYVSIISSEAAKIESISNFVTNANFDLKASEIKQDFIQFIDQYIKEMYLIEEPILKSSLDIFVNYSSELEHNLEFRPLEITTFVDNFIQNSEKAKAKKIEFIFTKNENGILNLTIQDNGNGIPDDAIPHIFDFGFTTTNGSGIGLFNVKSVVERMKWQIAVESNNKGTKFNITIL